MNRSSGADGRMVPALLATVVTAGLMLWASFYPAERVWGLAVWAYFDVWLRLLAVGLLLLLAGIIFWRLRAATSPDSVRDTSGPLFILLVAVTCGVCFYVFRTRAHFLGDGYLLLNSLASENPLLRWRNYGEMVIHLWIRDLLPLEREAAALAAFRLVSIGAGVLHAGLIAWLAPRLVGDRDLGRLFALGMITVGPALLFFGYVENYSLFGLAVAVYTYVGMLVAQERLRPLWVVVAFAGALFFHALGLVLVLPTIYLLATRTFISRKFHELQTSTKAASAILLLLAVGSAGYVVWSRYLFLRFALVPWPGGFFVLEGYSMFSLQHFADVANLLFLLVPAILVLVVTILQGRRDEILSDPRMRFLAVATASVFAGAFLFEAKIGMPRDWDLFSFAGYPLMAFLLLGATVVTPRSVVRGVLQVTVLLGLVFLVPRVLTAQSPERSVQQFRNYADIDIRKNRSGWYVLLQYFEDQGDSTRYHAVADQRLKRFPEDTMADSADAALSRKSPESASRFDWNAIRLNPTLTRSWANLGSCYLDMDKYDSAVWALETANALNPDSPRDLSLLGLAYFLTGRFDDAEDAYLYAFRLDTAKFVPVMALARLYQKTGDEDKYVTWLTKAVYRKEADGTWATELGDACLKRGNAEAAGRAFAEALRRGADSLKIMQRLAAHPELKRYIRP